MNYPFNLEEWIPRFPLDPDAKIYSGESITGPGHVCNNELLRRGMQDQYEWGSPVPVDIFVMAEGEPANRHATKVGGLPYRPASAKKTDLNFLAQFNFCDSTDLTGDLPGDILLVFADETFESLEFEWQPLGLDDLTSTSNSALNPCYGHIHRTVSFPAAKRVVPHKQQQYPVCRGKQVWAEHFVLKYQAMQIGTEPFFIQGDPELPGRLLCTISSVLPHRCSHYPWINHAEPLLPQGKPFVRTNDLMIWDAGCIYISIDRKQRLHWGADCY